MAYVRKTKEQRENEMKEHYNLLVDGVKQITSNPEEYKRYLDYASQFPSRSFRNQMMIFTQRPDANLVAGMVAWNKLGRQLIKGAKGIKIFAPITKKEKEIDEKTKEEVEKVVVKGYRMVNVFDVKDTKGVPLPLNPLVPNNVPESKFAEKVFYPLLKTLRKELPIHLDDNYKAKGNGFYSPLEHKIVVKTNGRDITNQLRTLIHEYAHSTFHNMFSKYKDADKQTREFQAESMAYLTAKSFGMDTGIYTFPYLKGWTSGMDEKVLIELQKDIQKESDSLIKKIEDVVLENGIKFDVPVVLRENKMSLIENETPIRLIQFGDNYSLIKGDIKEGSLNNLESIKSLGQYFGNNKDEALNTFESLKGYIGLNECRQLDNLKGRVHMYQRTLENDEGKREVFFIGAASLTNVKALTPSIPNKDVTLALFKDVIQDKGLSSEQKIINDLKTRDSDNDGLTDYQEMRLGTNPLNPDTDNDGIPDGRDVHPKTPDKDQELTL
ncbi:thrombospondin type 3 repeat-containing protein [Bacillus haynesii]|uniref:thrombospondin type 3 repeat-containing protein n=1 Tax=Bacillus haynesii TaxID=1925021 RepID=UPI00227E95E6|nr:thrombospondin type 3 repeat-containing protein [Bacillus haynesii]MCY8737543.1 thrombospondin type 3 repeat-containing protein [Bacillus haynesii]